MQRLSVSRNVDHNLKPQFPDAHGSVKLLPAGTSTEHYPLLSRQQRLKHSSSTPRFPSTDETASAISKATVQRITGHKRQSSTASATTFQPGHRRGPSQITVDTQPKSEDLYHWILRAQKEHKERNVRGPVTEREVPREVNPMEILLSVFFWRVYEVGIACNIEIKVDLGKRARSLIRRFNFLTSIQS